MADPNTAKDQVEPDEFDTWFGEDEDDSYAYDEEEETVDEEPERTETSTESEGEDVPDEEVPDTGAEPATGEGSSEEQGTKGDDPYGWIAELDPEFRAKAESLVNATKSNAGRAAAEARQKAELQARLDQYAAQQEAIRRGTTETSAAKPEVTVEDVEGMDDAELAEFMEEYPNVARNVQKLIEQRTRQTREEVLAQVRPIQQEAEAARLYESKQRLRHEAAQIFNTAETGIDLDTVLNSKRWKEWYANQPEGYKQFISNANSVEDSVKVLEDFAAYADREMYALYQQQQEAQQKSEASSADETAARRKSARQGSSPRSRSAEISNRGGTGSSYEAIFNEIVDADS